MSSFITNSVIDAVEPLTVNRSTTTPSVTLCLAVSATITVTFSFSLVIGSRCRTAHSRLTNEADAPPSTRTSLHLIASTSPAVGITDSTFLSFTLLIVTTCTASSLLPVSSRSSLPCTKSSSSLLTAANGLGVARGG